MSCNCQKQPKMNTWGCGCNKMPEEPARKGMVKFCDICDPCNPNVTNVKICAFVVPTLEEGRYFKNSFIFVQEDDSVYFISDDRSEIPFGSRPKYIDNFDPTDSENKFKSTTVYDLAGHAAYVYGPDGTYMSIPLVATPVSDILAGDHVIVTKDGGEYTIAVDGTDFASASDVHDLTILVTNHTGRIGDLEEDVADVKGDISDLDDEIEHVHDVADDANELAVEAKQNASAAQQTANDAMSTANSKQDALTAGENISIVNNVISASSTTYNKATTSQNGLMSSEDRKVLKNTGIYAPAANATTSATDVTINFTKSESDNDGSNYTSSNFTTTIPAATTQVAGVMTAADKTAVDGIPVFTLTDTDPGTGGTLAANNFIVVYEV